MMDHIPLKVTSALRAIGETVVEQGAGSSVFWEGIQLFPVYTSTTVLLPHSCLITLELYEM